jgi:transcriptional regulator with XRE-family HTH domain
VRASLAFPPPAEDERAPAIPRSSPDELSRAIGASLRAARLRAGLSLKELAQRSRGRYKPSSLGGYERGERAISVLRFCELAQLVGIPADQLMGEAMARHLPQDYREVLLDLSDLPDSDVGRHAAAHAHRVRTLRGDYLSNVVTLRAGDLQVIASATGLGVPALLSALETAVRRVGPD